MSVNLNANRGTNASANIVAPSKQVTKQSKWTDLFKDKRVLGGLTAAAGLTGYLVTRVGSNENIPQPSSSFQNLAILTTVLTGVGVIASQYLNLRQKANPETYVKKSIENALYSELTDESYHNYAKALQQDFPEFLKLIEKRHNEKPFTQNEISHLFSHSSIGKITNPIHIEMLQNCINTSTPLNQMIKAAVENACSTEIKYGAVKIQKRELNGYRQDENKSLLLKNIMKNPLCNSPLSYSKIESETDYGLQVYTRLSYELVMEQIGKLKDEDNTGFVRQLGILLKDKDVVRQMEEMPISPFNQEALESISNMLDKKMIYSIGRGNIQSDYPFKEKYFEFVENKFINYANDNLSIVLDQLCRLDEMEVLKQDTISLLFTEKFVQHLCEENITKLKEQLNEDSHLNLMIFAALGVNCDNAVFNKSAPNDLVNYFKLIPSTFQATLSTCKMESYYDYDKISELAKEPSKKRDPIRAVSKEADKSVSEKSVLAKMVDNLADKRTEDEKKYDEGLEYSCGPDAGCLKLKDSDAFIRLQIIRCLNIDEKIKNSYINMFNANANYQTGNERIDFSQRFITLYGSETNYKKAMKKECITYAQNNKDKVLASIEQIKNLDLNEKEREVSKQIIEELESHLEELNLNEKEVSKQERSEIESSSTVKSNVDDENPVETGDRSDGLANRLASMLMNNNINNSK